MTDDELKADYKAKYVVQNSPHERANIFQKSMFTWMNPMIDITYKLGELDQDMHYQLRKQDKTEEVCAEFEQNWKTLFPKGYLEPGTQTPSGGFFKVI